MSTFRRTLTFLTSHQLAFQRQVCPRKVGNLCLINKRAFSGVCADGCNCKCQSCGQSLGGKCALFCQSVQCGKIQRLDEQRCSYFDLYGLPEQFNLEPSAVEQSFKNLQRQLHPDKFTTKSADELKNSTHNSTIVNEAYHILKSPFERANYLVGFD